MRTGVANLLLHTGKAPPWLFKRMVKLAGAVTDALLLEYNQEELLRRLSNPSWFQAFSCVLAYDWHSSGTTTVTCGALKEALNKGNFGVKVAGGKGAVSRKAPEQIERIGEEFSISTPKLKGLVYSSRQSAKVDNSCIQDSYQLYQHSFFLTERGNWAVIQQGMNSGNSYARRYHWLSDEVNSFVEEPHQAICCDHRTEGALDLTSSRSEETRKTSVDLVKEKNLASYFRPPAQKSLTEFSESKTTLNMPKPHLIADMHQINQATLRKAYELQPGNYEELVAIKGVGPKTLRSLALISELIYGTQPSWKDPAKFSFAHGGKDSVPYLANKGLMDRSTEALKNAVSSARIGKKEKLHAIKRLNSYLNI